MPSLCLGHSALKGTVLNISSIPGQNLITVTLKNQLSICNVHCIKLTNNVQLIFELPCNVVRAATCLAFPMIISEAAVLENL